MTTDRHQRIVTLIRERPSVSCLELRGIFGVTAMTVWRDLRELEELGLFPGGWLSQVSGNVVGPETLQFIEKQRASISFLSAAGFDPEFGPTDPNPLEIEVKRTWAAVPGRVVLLLDSGKFGVRSAAVMIHPRRLHAVVADAPPPPEISACLMEHGVEVVIAE